MLKHASRADNLRLAEQFARIFRSGTLSYGAFNPLFERPLYNLSKRDGKSGETASFCRTCLN